MSEGQGLLFGCTYTVTTEFSENNSGGDWWLTTRDYDKLKAAGWETGRTAYDGHPRAATHTCTITALDAKVARQAGTALAIAEWEAITGKDHTTIGCPCCGMPFQFYDWDEPVEVKMLGTDVKEDTDDSMEGA